MSQPLSAAQLEQIQSFELQLYGAQSWSTLGGSLNEPDGPSGIGPQAMAKGSDGVLGNNTTRFVIPMEDKWAKLPAGNTADEKTAQCLPRIHAARP